jgi:diguanylate cyclase (GGDEF)-like protein
LLDLRTGLTGEEVRKILLDDLHVSKPKATVLVVDDTQMNLRIVSELLSRQGYAVQQAHDGEAALESVRNALPDLILLDIRMPGLDGYQVCERLKIEERTKDIPVIFISALDEVLDKVKAFSAGGVDYITKPFQVDEVLARVETHLALRRLRKELEEQNLRLEQEISERKKMEVQLRLLAVSDPLTNIFNRRHFFALAEKEMARASRYDHPMSVVLMDIDHFKRVNDTHGHLVGDQVLVALTKMCAENMRTVDIFARYGGEEFSILLPETGKISAFEVAERLRLKIAANPFEVNGFDIPITVSLGVASTECEVGISLDELLDRADKALYRSKNEGRDRVYAWEKQ